MLPKKNRLTDTKDFDKVKGLGKTFFNIFFKIAIFDKEKEKPSRFGVVVPKSVVSGAVSRNKIKRLVREGLRGELAAVTTGKDVVIVVRRNLVKEKKEAKEKLTALLKKSKIL